MNINTANDALLAALSCADKEFDAIFDFKVF